MAYGQHIRVVISGALVAGTDPAEIWSCTINGLPVTGTVASFDCDTYLNTMRPNLSTWFSAVANGNSTTATLKTIKANAIDTNGRYLSSTATHRYDYATPVSGGSGTVNPEIITSSIGWTTAAARGPGSKGRIFPPNFTLGDGSSMTLTTADITKLVSSGKGLLSAIKGVSGSPQLQPVIASGVTGTTFNITGVRIGNIKDVQRRRKSAFPEAYTTAVWP